MSAQSAGLNPAIHKKLDSIAGADVPPNAPGVAVAIVRGPTTLYEKYIGYANLEDSIPISANVRFNIASNGKQFTALAILCLEHQRKLNLQDDIRTYFPTLLPQVKEKITIESLLNHTSGIRDIYDLLSLQGMTWWKQALSNADVFNILNRQQSLNFTPTTAHLYSNSNYILLALLIEKITKQSFVEFTTTMFNDLGMPNTSFEDNYQAIRGPIAKPYFNFSTWSSYPWIWNATGDGNLFSTLPDLIQWEKIIHGAVTCNIPLKVIHKSQQKIGNSLLTGYGFGVEFKTYKGLSVMQHEGATGAWKAFFVRIPEKKLSLITLTNSGKVIPSLQTMSCLDVLLNLESNDKFYNIKPDAAGPSVHDEDILGIYTNTDGFYFEFIRLHDDIYLRRSGRNDVQLVRTFSNTFRQRYDTTFYQAFSRDARGQLQVTAYHPSHPPYTLVKEMHNWENFNAASLYGTFVNEETGAMLHIKNISGRQATVYMGEKEQTALICAPGKMLLNGYYITFDQTSSDRLYLHGNRIKQVVFNRK